jgi:hypothetical protein
MKADLHCHTTHSDGTKTVKEIIDLASNNNVDVLSITDHDICKDIDFAKEYASKLGITFIPGVELSTLHKNKSVHVLGYFKDDSYKSDSMINYYKMIKEGRENRTHKFIENLKHYFEIEITYEDVLSFSSGLIARPHIAKAINYKYPQYSFNYIFEEFIGDHSIAYVPSTQLPVEEGVKLLRENNAVAVLAHPTLLKDFIRDEVLSMSFDGIEAVYYRNKDDDEEKYRKYASENNIIVTAGSDYHGIENDTKHGMIGEVSLKSDDIKLFLDKVGIKVNK